MAEHFAKDRFDEIPNDLKRVGAHRAPARKSRGWFAFLWAALATIVLVSGGIAVLLVLGDRVNFVDTSTGAPSETSVPSETPTAVATIDPNAMVTVLNGTEQQGLATTAIVQLNAAGWTQDIAGSKATESNIETTTVYYEDASQEGAARGLAEALGASNIQLSTQFQIPVAEGETPILQLTVVLGSDYSPPSEG